jgi:CRP-like cAMP-binding protein
MNDSPDPRRAILDREGLFAPLSSAERDALAPKLVRREFTVGQPVVRQGDAGDSLFLIVEGNLAAMFSSGGTPARQAGKLGPGDCFGEMSLLTGALRSATVLARSDGVAYELAKADVAPILKARPQIAAELGQLLAVRKSVLDAIAAEHPEYATGDIKGLGAAIGRWIVAGFQLAPGMVI